MYQMTIGQHDDDFIGPPPPPTGGSGAGWSSWASNILGAGASVVEKVLIRERALATLKTQRALAQSQAERDAIALQITRLQQDTERIKAGGGSIPSWVWMAGAGVGALVLIMVVTRR